MNRKIPNSPQENLGWESKGVYPCEKYFTIGVIVKNMFFLATQSLLQVIIQHLN